MKTIQKFTLDLEKDLQMLSLREGYRIVQAEYLMTEKEICLWVEVPLRADIPFQDRIFAVKETNQPVPLNYLYIHSAIDALTPQAFHIFEVPQSNLKEQQNRQFSVLNGTRSGLAA